MTAVSKKIISPKDAGNAYPEGKELLKKIVRLLYDKKGERMSIFDLTEEYYYTDYIVIVQGTSDRHVRAMADSLFADFKQQGLKPLGYEGYDTGQWILIDFGDVIIHIFQEPIRDMYDLEGIWSKMPSIAPTDLLPEDYFKTPKK